MLNWLYQKTLIVFWILLIPTIFSPSAFGPIEMFVFVLVVIFCLGANAEDNSSNRKE